MKDMYDLECRFDSAKSFYSKAKVLRENNKRTLYSYDTKVASIVNGTLKVFNTQSNTTCRHIREFALQNGFDYMTKKQMEELK